VLPPGHALAKRRQLPWRALDGVPLVLLDHASGSRRLIDAAFAAQGLRCEVRQQVGHVTTAFRMVEAGIGLSVMPAMAVPAAGLRQLVLRPLTPRVERAVMLVHRRNRAPAPLAQRVWQLIREIAQAGHPPA